jgi:hypothetical protein
MSSDSKIRIHTVDGGDPQDHDALRDNYFQATGVNDTYQFFDVNGKVIDTDPVVFATGYDFMFKLKGMHDIGWWITKFNTDGRTATGNWTNTHRKDDDDGSFQADAKGTVMPEASSAKA